MKRTRRLTGGLAAVLVAASLQLSGCGDESPNGPTLGAGDDTAVQPSNGGMNDDTSHQGPKGDGNRN